MSSYKTYARRHKASLGKKKNRNRERLLHEQQAQILITCRHPQIVSDIPRGEEGLFKSPSCNYMKTGVETIDTWQMKPILKSALL